MIAVAAPGFLGHLPSNSDLGVKLRVFNTAYTSIGLFDRSLLPMSLIQVELALKQATSKSRTPVSIYQFNPI